MKNCCDTYESCGLRDYSFYDCRCGNSRERRCIDGRKTSCGKCVGYCQYVGHSGFLTELQRTQHKCIEKGCFYYLPKLKQPVQQKKGSDDYLREISALAGKLTEDYEGMRVMNVVRLADKSYGVKYVTITNEYPIEAVGKKLSTAFGVIITMVNLNYDFDRVVHLIFAN